MWDVCVCFLFEDVRFDVNVCIMCTLYCVERCVSVFWIDSFLLCVLFNVTVNMFDLYFSFHSMGVDQNFSPSF